MDFTQDLRRNSVTWAAFDKAAFPNPTAITIGQLNTTNPILKLDITCALDEDSTNFTLGSSDLDERLSFCDGTGRSRPTGTKPELALGLYRDADRNATGVFNAALEWFKHEGTELYIVQRVGPQDSGPTGTGIGEEAKPFETTDDIRVGLFSLDNPIDTVAETDPVILTINPIPAGFLAWNWSPLA